MNIDWDGKGLPKDGALVQIKLGPSWTTVTCVATYAGQAVICWTDYDGDPIVSMRDVSELRPVETARKKILNDLVSLIEGADAADKTIAEAIYDAGYRKFEIVEEDV